MRRESVSSSNETFVIMVELTFTCIHSPEDFRSVLDCVRQMLTSASSSRTCVSVEGNVRTRWAVTGVCVSEVTVETAPTAQVSQHDAVKCHFYFTQSNIYHSLFLCFFVCVRRHK